MSWRTGFTIGRFSSFVFLWGILAGCSEREPGGVVAVHFDETALHQVLTLFFDGVPPLDNGMVEAKTGNADPNVLEVRTRPEADWYLHAPLKDCVRCHGERQQRNFSREVRLIAGVPELCYACHAALVPTALKGWAHGPVAAGECLACHEPHKTRNPQLLRKQVPALCYTCHQEMADESGPDDAGQPHSDCIYCHTGHVDSRKHATDRAPQLCYECHAAYAPTALEGWVHGPVAVGQCLTCHDLHGTENPRLLRERIPELCYRCHEETFVKSAHDHWDASYVDCSNCHEGHASPERPLLRQNRQPKNAGIELPGGISEPSGQ